MSSTQVLCVNISNRFRRDAVLGHKPAGSSRRLSPSRSEDGDGLLWGQPDHSSATHRVHVRRKVQIRVAARRVT